MKYFIPEWDDRVDPKYNFITDTHSELHHKNPVENDVYTWNIFGIEDVPIDGVIVSRMPLMESRSRYKRVLDKGIHSSLRLPSSFEIMGDCGAFGYVDEQVPPFQTKEVLDYYIRCGFNYGVSVDHLIVPAHKDQNQERWEITLANAREMFELWRSKDKYMNSIRIMGAAQGWDVPSYRKAIRELLNIGYDYIGLGGLVRAPTGSKMHSSQSKTVLNVVKATWFEVSKWIEKTKGKIDIHLFGIARPETMTDLMKHGVTSFDSASFLRRAWLSATKNYYATNGQGYAAFRVRFQKEDSPLKSLEQKALKKIRLFAKNQASKEEAIETLEEYEMEILQTEILSKPTKNLSRQLEKQVWRILEGNTLTNGEIDNFVNELELNGEDANKAKLILRTAVKGTRRIADLGKHYARTLDDKPWRNCGCPICRNIGAEVLIFRGNNRNRRRGFHNTYVFYKQFREVTPRILVFTNCTMKKDESSGLISSFRRYLPSPPFKVFWKSVYDLPVDVAILSAKFGLIDWSKRIPNYNYKMQKSDAQKFVEELKEKLQKYNKIFFLGLGLYRNVVQRVKDETSFDIEIFPKKKLTKRDKLDIIEYTKQVKYLRQTIIQAIPEQCRPYVEKDVTVGSQPSLDRFIGSENAIRGILEN